MSGGNQFTCMVLLCLTSAFAASADDRIPDLGVVTANAAWESAAENRKAFSEIAAAGFASVRIGLRDPLAATFRTLEAARDSGLRVLVTIPLVDGAIARPDAEPRERHGRFFQVYGLSGADVGRYRRRLDSLLAFCARRKIPLAGIELGNEPNWSGYNGDLVLAQAGKLVSTGADWSETERQGFDKGLDTYLEIVRETRRALGAYPSLADTRIVSAGLADANARFVAGSGATLIASRLVYRGFAERGIFSEVDVVGIHLYEPLRLAAGGTSPAPGIDAALSGCGRPAFNGRPCWITEFGVALPAQACAGTDTARISSVRPLFDFLATAGNTRRITATYYYDWNQDPAFALQRCGRLTPLAGFMAGETGKGGLTSVGAR